MPKKESGNPFKSLRSKQVSELRAILGQTDAVERYLERMDVIIHMFKTLRKVEVNRYRSPAQAIAKLNTISQYTRKLIAELHHAAVKMGENITAETPVDGDLWAIFQHAQALNVLREGKAPDGDYLYKLVGTLKHLEETTSTALTTIASPKRGDSSGIEREQKSFESNMLLAYEQSFGCYPSQTQGGAFQRSAEIFYNTLNLPKGNSFQRIRNAIKRSQKSRFPKGVPARLQAKRGLHPNGR